MTSQAWLTLIVAILGTVGTLTGALLATWLQSAGERRRREAEWLREDRDRYVQGRYETYLEFLRYVQQLRTAIESYARADDLSELAALMSGFVERVRDVQVRVDLIGSGKVKARVVGLIALVAAWPIVTSGVTRGSDGMSKRERHELLAQPFGDAYNACVDAMREDLGSVRVGEQHRYTF